MPAFKLSATTSQLCYFSHDFSKCKMRMVIVIGSEDSMTKYLAQCLTNINAKYVLFRVGGWSDLLTFASNS